MSKTKDDNHYKKLYRKLKDTTKPEFEKLFKEIEVLRTVLIIIAKKSKTKKIKITLEEVKAMENNDKLYREIEKNGDIIFEYKKVE